MSGPGTPRSLPPLGENAVTRTFLAIHNNPETVKEGGVVVIFLQNQFWFLYFHTFKITNMHF